MPEAQSAPRPAPSSDPEETLARILLVQACEESDPEARLVPRREREAATRDARATAEAAPGLPIEPGRFFAERAARLSAALVHRHAALRAALGLLRLRVPGAPVLAAALVAGFMADTLGSERRINLLAFPLLALLAWNAAMYALMLVAPLLARREPAAGLASLAARGAGWLATRRIAGVAPEEARWLTASLHRFTALWTAQSAPILAARLRRLLHLGALGVAAGIVAGMYVRGLAFEYRASWESTFLEAPSVARLLGVVLGPAATALDTLHPGLRPPATLLLDEPSIAALRAPAGDGPAATWIHLWALTTGAAIVAPRALLALREGHRARRLARALAPPLDDPYFLRLRAPDRGAGVRVEVLPYSHRLAPPSNDALLELLHELFGNRSRVEVRPPLGYGAEPPPLPAAGAPHARVVVFNLAQSPEEEVHGVFLAALRAAQGAAAHPPALLALLDEEPYRARLGAGGGHERIAQRWRAWERVGRAADLRFAALRPLAADADEILANARAALDRTVAGEAA